MNDFRNCITSSSDVFVLNEVFLHILSHVSTLDLKCAACTCRRWHLFITKHFDLNMFLVSVSGNNEIILMSGGNNSACHNVATRGTVLQRFKASPDHHKKRKRSTMTTRSRIRNTWCWPTCMAWGPQGQLFVSQYKVAGVLEFQRTFSINNRSISSNNKEEFLRYRRTLVSEQPSFSSPEGLVYAHNSLYVVSVENGSVSRLEITNGKLMEVAHKTRSNNNSNDDDDDFYTLWGMCASPDQSRLYIAAHRAQEGIDGDNYRQPTRINTGRILRLDLETDGSFWKDRQLGVPYGYYEEGGRSDPNTRDDTSAGGPLFCLNRPSAPAFCPHGVLHVTSFVSFETGTQRRVYKWIGKDFTWLSSPLSSSSIFPSNNLTHSKEASVAAAAEKEQPLTPSKTLGWLEAQSGEESLLLQGLQPWGIAFATNGGGIYISSHGLSSEMPNRQPVILKLSTCGCDDLLTTATTPSGGGAIVKTTTNTTRYKGPPKQWCCGNVTVLAESSDAMNFLNYILPV